MWSPELGIEIVLECVEGAGLIGEVGTVVDDVVVEAERDIIWGACERAASFVKEDDLECCVVADEDDFKACEIGWRDAEKAMRGFDIMLLMPVCGRWGMKNAGSRPMSAIAAQTRGCYRWWAPEKDTA